MIDTGWLIELNEVSHFPVYYLKLVPEDSHPGLDWTSDGFEALRFARQQDATVFAATFLRNIAIRVIEHSWV